MSLQHGKLKQSLSVVLFCSSLFSQSAFSEIIEDELIEESELFSIYGDEALVSIASGISQPIIKAPSVTSVVTAKDIVAMGATDIDQILETIPGLHVSA